MTDNTIVAVFDTAPHADAAIRDLRAAGVPENMISRHASDDTKAATSTTAQQPVREQGFWSTIFGGEPENDTTVYDRSMESGSHIVSVRVGEEHVEQVMSVLEKHQPIDLDERAASYGVERGAMGGTASRPTAATAAASAAGAATMSDTATDRNVESRAGEQVIPLAEEKIDVGKRLINRGTTRIRRYVVETPVEENVSLHSERVTIDRRPATAGAPVKDADFTDKTVEMTESDEEAVIAKTARVREEVVIRKNASDRTETVRDTVRRQDVEIEKDDDERAASAKGGPGATAAQPGAPAAGAAPDPNTVPPVRR